MYFIFFFHIEMLLKIDHSHMLFSDFHFLIIVTKRIHNNNIIVIFSEIE